MEDFQYYHGRLEKHHWKEFTVCCVVPSLLDFITTIEDTLNTNDIFFGIKVGYTLVNPKDQYCKRTGREMSFANIKYTKFTLAEIVFKKDKIIYTFESDHLMLQFESKPTRNKLFFIRAEHLEKVDY